MRLSLSYNQDHSLQITHPVQERFATSPLSFSSTPLEQWCGFFRVSQEPDKTGPAVFVLI